MANGKGKHLKANSYELELTRAKAQLVIRYPFIASILLKLGLREDESIPFLGCTNGSEILINPKLCEEHSLNFNQLMGLLAHEVWHVALLHIVRRGDRNEQKWNFACDHCVNEMLMKDGIKLPEGAVYFPEFENMSAEEVYNRISDPPENWTSIGVVLDGEGNPVTLEANIKEIVASALNAAKSAGKLPKDIEEVIDGLLYPAIPWYDLLRNYLMLTFSDGFTWEKPCKRYVAHGVYLPTRKLRNKGNVAVLMDTSGSMTEDDLLKAETELSSIIQDCKANATVVFFDSAVQKVEEYSIDDLPIKLSFKGRGGTDYRPPFNYLKERGIQPDVIICVTDLLCDDFPDEPEAHVFWVRTSDYHKAPPFGTVIPWEGGNKP